MTKKIEDIFISKGYKPFWKLLFPYGCFAIALFCIYDGYIKLIVDKEVEVMGILLGWSFSAIILIILGVYFGRVQDYHFDFIKRKYKKVQRVGFIGFGSWKEFKNLEYVSLFENLDDLYQINLWYNSNKHFDIDTFWNYDDAVEVATDLSNKLEIDFHNSVNHTAYDFKTNSNRVVKDADRQVDVHISQGTRPVWKTLVVTALLLLSLILLYDFYQSLDIEIEDKQINFDLMSLSFAGIVFFVVLMLAVVKDYQFDFKNDQFKLIYRVGPIKYGVWEKLESLDYVSVYQKKPGKFEVNLWYNTNQNVNFKTYDEPELAFKVGKTLAKKLFIKVLDASDPHDTKWVAS